MSSRQSVSRGKGDRENKNYNTGTAFPPRAKALGFHALNKMKILVFNQGSSSLKCSLFQFDHLPQEHTEPLWEKSLDWKKTDKRSVWEKLALSCSHRPDVIGHRIVHGGKNCTKTTLIDSYVKEQIRAAAQWAPLHNLSDLEGVEMGEKTFPAVPQIAVFDTTFHQTMPLCASIYPGPYEWVEQGIVRYGFHGISYQYCSRRASEMAKGKKQVICHLGAGASLCAVEGGKSIDTTMGFTPLEGLMMDTRSGSVDPGVLLYLLKKKTAESLAHDLYEKSGLLGISGHSEDMRDVIKKGSEGDSRSLLALDIYLHRLTGSIAAMAASLRGIDTLVFTGGIGENASLIRERVCEDLHFLGVELNTEKNGYKQPLDTPLSTSRSTVQVLLIHTQETFEIARECWLYRS